MCVRLNVAGAKKCLAIYNFEGARASNSKSTPITKTTMQIGNIISLLLKFLKKVWEKGWKKITLLVGQFFSSSMFGVHGGMGEEG